jgi:hypothetical protein
MTINNPEDHQSQVWRNIAIGICLTLATMLSSWLIVGKGWLQTRGEDERQISINTVAIQKLQDNERNQTTREEHRELLDRLTRLETMMPSRAEMQTEYAARDALLQSMEVELRNEASVIADLRSQVSALQQALADHERNEKSRLQEGRQP